MPSGALHICKHQGCNVLLKKVGYCNLHIKYKKIHDRSCFDSLPIKTAEQRRFYNSRAWRAASEHHRRNEPLCRRCKDRDRIQAAELVHHNPDYNILIANGLSPFNEQYLVSLCNKCHLEDLRAKKGLNNVKR